MFPTPVIYQRPVAGVYDPATGTVTPAGTTDYPINAGVLSRGRMEEGGASETYELRLWVHHGAGGLPFVPETGDQVSYDGRIWRVVGRPHLQQRHTDRQQDHLQGRLMPRFTEAKALADHLKKAATELQKESVVTAQAWLGDSSNVPRDTGRMRSSWFAQVGSASSAVAPEGTDAPNTDAQSLELQPGQEAHLTNNLPYSQPIALGVNLPPSWGGQHRVVSAPVTWFKDFRDQKLPLRM